MVRKRAYVLPVSCEEGLNGVGGVAEEC